MRQRGSCLRVLGAAARVGEWLSLVEHLVRDQGVGGSNPLSPTNTSNSLQPCDALIKRRAKGGDASTVLAPTWSAMRSSNSRMTKQETLAPISESSPMG